MSNDSPAIAAGDHPHPHHLAQQLPPIQFSTSASDVTVAAQSGPTGDAEKAASSEGDEDAALSSAGEKSGTGPAAPAGGALDYPDGGWRAWSVVGGAWCISFCAWGYTNAYGVYQTYYADHQLSEYSHSDISWIGSLQLALVLACAIGSGKVFDAGGIKLLLGISLCLYTACLFGLSYATEYYQILLAQGLGCGLAAGIAFVPAASSVSHWFKKRRATALGILATGSSVGGMVLPALLNNLFDSTGFGWAVRASAFMIIGLVGIALLTINSRLPPRPLPKVHQIFDFSPLKETGFLLFVIGETIIMWGLYFSYFYIQDYARAYGVSKNLTDYALTILNAASIFGRIIPNWLADTYGPLTILTPNCIISGILCFCFIPACKSAGGLIAFCILFGFSSGAYVSMMPATTASLTKDMTQVGHRTAVMFLVISIAGLTGTPITGAIISREGGYVGAACFSGVTVLVGSAFNMASWWVVSREKGTKWV
ncbi:hypothetical protein JCM8097_009027 [Rhodosporidiobolus ruineniae]